MIVRFAMYDPAAHGGTIEFERLLAKAEGSEVLAALRTWDDLHRLEINPERLQVVFELGLKERGSVMVTREGRPRDRVGFFHILDCGPSVERAPERGLAPAGSC